MNEREQQDQGAFEKIGEQVGGAAGRAMGRSTEMAVDAFGAMLGSAVDAMGQWWASAEAAQAMRSFDDSRDKSCREHFQSAAASPAAASDAATSDASRYDEIRPLYQFGHTARQNPEFSGRSFEDVESDLQRAWGDDRTVSYGDWPEIRGYVGFGYEGDPATPDSDPRTSGL